MQRQSKRLPFSSVLFIVIVIVIVQNVLRYSSDLAPPSHLPSFFVPSIVSLLLYPNCAVAGADGGDGRVGEGADFVELTGGGGGGGVDEVGEVLEEEDGIDGEVLHGELGVGFELVGGAGDSDGVLLHLDKVSFGTDGLQEIWVGLEVEATDGDVRV